MFNSVYGTLQYLLDYTAVKPILIRLQIKKKQYTGIIMECDYKNTVATIISVWQGSITQSVFLGRPGYKTRIQGHRLFCSGHSSLINLDRMALCQVYISTCQCLFCLSQGSLLPTWSSALVCQNLKYSMFFSWQCLFNGPDKCRSIYACSEFKVQSTYGVLQPVVCVKLVCYVACLTVEAYSLGLARWMDWGTSG